MTNLVRKIKEGDSVSIGDIKITVLPSNGKGAKLLFTVPKEIKITLDNKKKSRSDNFGNK